MSGGASSKKLVTSLDIRVQSVIHETLKEAVAKYRAIGGNAMLMNMEGEILSIVSLPDYDPNNLKKIDIKTMFNRNTLGTFEPGSVFKILNVAIALEVGTSKLGSIFDTTEQIKIGRFQITDYRGKNRPLTLTEAFVYSSNIAAVKISQSFGSFIQKKYMERFGVFSKINLEIPEIGRPIFPVRWNNVTSMTASYGYGLSVTPLHLLSIISAIASGGKSITPTLLKNHGKNYSTERRQLVSKETSKMVLELLRAAVCYGTAKRAGIDGIEIFGKTGTTYKSSKGGYGSEGNRTRITTFIGGFPKSQPQYVLLVMLDDPKSTPDDGKNASPTASRNATPTAGKIFERTVPMLSDGSIKQDSGLCVTQYIHPK
jgi:cell division protein FtsI (penicillin-binding protein 3)